MAHEHHHHDHTVTSLNKAFILGIALNVAFVVVEFAVGLYYGSMGLLSDAGHNLSDVASLLLAMLAFRLAQAHATPRYTYGYKKSTVLISLLNSVILLVAVAVGKTLLFSNNIIKILTSFYSMFFFHFKTFLNTNILTVSFIFYNYLYC